MLWSLSRNWWSLVLGGILGIAVGVLTFMQPAAMALAQACVIGAWAIVTGLLEIVASACAGSATASSHLRSSAQLLRRAEHHRFASKPDAITALACPVPVAHRSGPTHQSSFIGHAESA